MKNRLTIERGKVKAFFKQTVKQPGFYLFLLLAGVFIFAYSTVRMFPDSDDVWYPQMIAEPSGILSFLSYTYHYLNGRIVANALMYLMLQLDFMPLWVLISSFATVSIAYNVARMFGKRPSWKSVNLALGLIMCFGFRVLSSSMLWFTGAICYLWPIAVAVYLLARLSVRYHSEAPLKFGWRGVLELILGIAVMFWGEQFALILIGFWLCYLAYVLFSRKKKPSWFEYFFACALLAGFLTMFFAPSQALKMTNVYGYAAYEGGFGYLLANGLCWTFQSIFVHQRIFVILFGVLTLLCADRSKHRALIFGYEIVLCIPILSVLLNGLHFGIPVDPTEFLYRILYLPDAGYTVNAWMPYLFWTLYTVLTLTVFLMNTKRKRLTGLVLLASVASLVIMLYTSTTLSTPKKANASSMEPQKHRLPPAPMNTTLSHSCS